MKKRPLSFTFISLCYFVAPLVQIAQIAYFNDWPFLGPRSVFYHLSIYEWSILAVFPVIAIGLFKVTKWGYSLFIAFSAFLILNNALNYFVSPTYNTNILMLVQIFLAGLVGLFLQKHNSAPYFNPQLKWWERDARYHVNLGARLKVGQNMTDCNILDISKGGCFAQLDKRCILGNTYWLTINLDDIHFNVMGRVMWDSKFNPKGYGLMFVGMQEGELRALRTLMNALKQSQNSSVQNIEKYSRSA